MLSQHLHAPGRVAVLSMQQSGGLLHSRASGAGAGRRREAMSGASRRSRKFPRGASRGASRGLPAPAPRTRGLVCPAGCRMLRLLRMATRRLAECRCWFNGGSPAIPHQTFRGAAAHACEAARHDDGRFPVGATALRCTGAAFLQSAMPRSGEGARVPSNLFVRLCGLRFRGFSLSGKLNGASFESVVAGRLPQVHGRCGRKDPRKSHRLDRWAIMAHPRGKSHRPAINAAYGRDGREGTRCKLGPRCASVGAKTRSVERGALREKRMEEHRI